MIAPNVCSLCELMGACAVRPRVGNPAHKIADSDDPLCRNGTAIYGCHVLLSIVLDVSRWMFTSALLLARAGELRACIRSAGIAPFQDAHTPAITDANDGSVLLSITLIQDLKRLMERKLMITLLLTTVAVLFRRDTLLTHFQQIVLGLHRLILLTTEQCRQ